MNSGPAAADAWLGGACGTIIIRIVHPRHDDPIGKMKSYDCPNCKQASIPVKDKYFAGIWRIIHCESCGARLCANPYLMVLGWMIYVWAAAWFGFWAYLTGSFTPLIYLLPVWLFLDFLNINLMPLSVMRPKNH